MAKMFLAILFLCIFALAQIPHTFKAGDVAKSSEVNENLLYIMGRIDSLVLENTKLHAKLDTIRNTAILPIGTVIAVMTPLDTLSGIWVLADGRTATTEYFQATGENKVPDLRGMFLRGLNAGRSDGREDPQGAGRTAGNYQEDIFKSHTHSLTNNMITGTNGLFSGGSYGAVNPNFGATGGAETRPRNMAVYWYVKVK
ncbi:MAG: hypothetical protein JXA71_13050 [Chitinispirillaceae bacterium]|nr:hypothetical protein [Chitinispirillaceae bacterium]